MGLPGYAFRTPIIPILDELLATNYQVPLSVHKHNPTAVNQAVEFANSASAKAGFANCPTGLNDMTIEGWFLFSAFTNTGWRSLINMKDDGADKFWSIDALSTTDMTDVHFRAGFYDGTARFATSTNHVSVDTWYHLALVYDASDNGDGGDTHGTVYIYINGVVDTHHHLAADPSLALPASLRLALKYNDTDPAPMKMQEIRISNIARTPTEIAAAYNAGAGARLEADANTLALYHMDSGCWSVYPINAPNSGFYGSHHVLMELPGGDLVSYYYKGDAHIDDFTNSRICYKKSSDGGVTWGAEQEIYSPAGTLCVLPGGGGVTPDGSYILFTCENAATYHANPFKFGFFRSGAEETNPGEDWAASPTNLLPYNWTEDFLGTSRGPAFTESDANSKLTVTSSRATAADADTDEDCFLYWDFGSANIDALNVFFNLYIADTSQDGAVAGMAFSTNLEDITGMGADASVHVTMRRVGAAYEVYLGRGNDAATDNTAGLAANTVYYCLLGRTNGSGTVTCKIYPSSADRLAGTNIIDTLTIAGVAVATRFRYCFAFVNKNDGSGNKNFDGYVEELSFRWQGWITGRMIDVPGRGLIQVAQFQWYSDAWPAHPLGRIVYWLSVDDGVNWTGPWHIIDDMENQFTEPAVTYMGDGKLVMLLRTDVTDGNGNGHYFQMISNDSGVTWSAAVDTLWDAKLDGSVVGSMVQTQVDGDLIVAMASNRHSTELQIKVGEAGLVEADPTWWNTMGYYQFLDYAGGWPGYVSIILKYGNTAPRYTFTFVAADAARTYQNLYCAVPTAAVWNGEERKGAFVPDDSGKGNHLSWLNSTPAASGGLTQRWATGAFSGVKSAGWDGERLCVFLAEHCGDNLCDLRPTSLNGSTKLYYHLESQVDGYRAALKVKSPKVGSSILTANASPGDGHVHVTTTGIFAASDYLILCDDNDPEGEVVVVSSVASDPQIDLSTNVVGTYTTAANARLCHGFCLQHGKAETAHDGTYHDPENVYLFFESAESGVVGSKWTENNAAWGNIEYSAEEQRRHAKSLKFTQVSAVMDQDYRVDGSAWAAQTKLCVEYSVLQMAATAYFIFYVNGSAGFPLTHFLGLNNTAFEYSNNAGGQIDTGHDYVRYRWEAMKYLCTQADKVVKWFRDGKLISSDAHRTDTWADATVLLIICQHLYPNTYVYLDQVRVSKYEPTLAGNVGSPSLNTEGGAACRSNAGLMLAARLI